MEQVETVHGTDCPVAPLAEEAFTVIAAINREGNEAARLRASAAVHAQRQLDVLDDRLNGIADAAARSIASPSPSGRVFPVLSCGVATDPACRRRRICDGRKLPPVGKHRMERRDQFA